MQFLITLDQTHGELIHCMPPLKEKQLLDPKEGACLLEGGQWTSDFDTDCVWEHGNSDLASRENKKRDKRKKQGQTEKKMG